MDAFNYRFFDSAFALTETQIDAEPPQLVLLLTVASLLMIALVAVGYEWITRTDPGVSETPKGSQSFAFPTHRGIGSA